MPITIQHTNRVMQSIREVSVGDVFEYNGNTFIRIAELKNAFAHSGETLEHVVAVCIGDGKFLSSPDGMSDEQTQVIVHQSATLVVGS